MPHGRRAASAHRHFNPDQYRGDVLGHMGNPAALTPNLDAMAATDGVSFAHAFVQATVCTPSRCSFMSGWYPHVRGHRTMFHMMHSDEPVLLRTLKSEGYWVWWGGKNDLIPGGVSWEPYCSVRYPGRGPVQYSLHGDASWRGPVDADNYYSFHAGCLDDRGNGLPVDGDWVVVNEALSVIRNRPRAAAPMCLYLALGYPHPPYAVEEPFFSAIRRDRLPARAPTPVGPDGEPWAGKPAMLKEIAKGQGLQGWTEERWAALRATYYGQCARIDHQFGL